MTARQIATQRIFLTTVGLLLVLSASCQSRRLEAPNLDAVLWVRTSAEYRAASEQTYNMSRVQLGRILASKDKTWTAAVEQTGDYRELEPAIIVDVDDTVLDTSPFQAFLITRGASFKADLWKTWVRELKAAPVPGALAFIRWAHAQGVKIFYVTNREFDVESATIRNLDSAGFPVAADGSNVLAKDEQYDWSADKTTRRAFVARTHRILLIVGDDLNDFISVPGNDQAARRKFTMEHQAYWGLKWVMMPNPMYGRWERALHGSGEPLSHREIHQRKFDQLRGTD
jgi:acid phosphatase